MDLIVEDFGFTYFPGDTPYVQYGVIIRNPYAWVRVAADISVNITFLAANGDVVASDDDTISFAPPGRRVAVGDVAFPEGDLKPVKMEVALSNDWEEVTDILGEFTVSNVKTTTGSYSTSTTGRVAGNFATKQELVVVVAIYRNKAGRIIGGDSTILDFVPTSGKVSFKVSPLGKFRDLGKTEIYVML